MTQNVNVVIGAGLIGQAIARRVSAGKRVLLADIRQQNADVAARILSRHFPYARPIRLSGLEDNRGSRGQAIPPVP